MAKRGPNRKTHTRIGNLLFNLDFFNRHQVSQPNGCSLWTAGRHRQGYGMMGGYRALTNERFMTVVHRVAMMVKLNRELLPGECVSHSCMSALCVNPDHLVLGDHQLRSQMFKAKGLTKQSQSTGRYSRDHRKQNRKYKYSIEDMLFIRQAKIEEIIDRFGVSRHRAQGLRYGIRKGYAWLADYENK